MAKKVEGLSVDTLEKFAKAKYNVLLSGRHGCGKTAMIQQTFDKLYGPINVGWRYFSASTLDVFTDIIGVPTPVENPNKNSEHRTITRFAPPEGFTGDELIRAIFFDEVNRADEKTMNAIMELLQFKSINGRRFKNLEVVWGAENPAEDAEYMVRRMDPAQKDRFHIQLNVPYRLDENYFTSKFGREYFEVANKWWKSNSSVISPRKMEEMIAGFRNGFSVTCFSNECKNTEELEKNLAAIEIVSQYIEIAQCGDAKAIVAFFTMSRLRSNLAALKALSEKDMVTMISGIYEHMDEEVRKWLMTNFGKEVIIVQNTNKSSAQDVMKKLAAAGFSSPIVDDKAAASFGKAIKSMDARYDIIQTKLPEDIFFGKDGRFLGISGTIGGEIAKYEEFFKLNITLFMNVVYQASRGVRGESEITDYVAAMLSSNSFKKSMSIADSRVREFFAQLEDNEKGVDSTKFGAVHARHITTIS